MSQRLGGYAAPLRLPRREFLQLGLAGLALLGGRRLIESLALTNDSPVISGFVTDLLTGRPLAGATVRVAGERGSAVAQTDANGYYYAELPAGTYELAVTVSGYLAMASDSQIVRSGTLSPINFAMLASDPSPADMQAAYSRLVPSPESPLITPMTHPDLSVSSIDVPDSIVVRWSNGSESTMALDDYLRHVVPAEMPASWHPQALRAQAVAARSYAVAYYQTRGYICATTSCQYYGPSTYDSTDQAVWSTHNVVATSSGAIIWAFFFAQCNGATTRNSEEALANTGYGGACTVSGWSVVSYCRARSCSGHSPYGYNTCGYHGHGVGMCQNGAQGFAEQGLTYDQILQRFYTGIALIGADTTPRLLSPTNGFLRQTGSALTLSWQGTSASYSVVVMDSQGTIRVSTSTTATSTVVPGTLAAGTYVWNVTGSTGSATPRTSPTWRFTLANTIYNRPLPGVTKG